MRRSAKVRTNPRDDLLDLLLMRLRLQNKPDLLNADVLSEPKRDNLVKGSDEVESVMVDGSFVR